LAALSEFAGFDASQLFGIIEIIDSESDCPIEIVDSETEVRFEIVDSEIIG
jgi:hypothetical protein